MSDESTNKSDFTPDPERIGKAWLKAQKDARQRKLVELLKANEPVCDALLQAGYAPGVAHKGWRGVPKKVAAMLLDHEGGRFEKKGKALLASPDKLEARIVGAMDDAMVHGRSKGVNAAKVLTHHTSVASKFTPDVQSNVVVIQAPADFKPGQLKDVPDQPKPALPPGQRDLPSYE